MAELSAILGDLEMTALRSQMHAIANRPMTPQQLRVLGLLVLEGPQRSNAMAKLLGVSAATTSGLLDRLEHGGLITRQAVAGDARGRMVELTEAGRDALGQLLRAPFSDLDQLTEGLTDEELAGLALGIRGMVRERRATVPARPPDRPAPAEPIQPPDPPPAAGRCAKRLRRVSCRSDRLAADRDG
jgi:DNA-binding MarR family transcriptional regulator